MGKTVPPYRRALEEEIKKWKRFQKALRKQDRRDFQRMMDASRRHASAGGMATRPVVFEAFVISILLSHQKTLQELKESIDHIKEQM